MHVALVSSGLLTLLGVTESVLSASVSAAHFSAPIEGLGLVIILSCDVDSSFFEKREFSRDV